MKNKTIIAVIGGIILIGGVGYMLLKSPPAEEIPRQRIQVLATFFPLYDFARNVGKDRIELDLLFPQTPEIASFSPADVGKINRADVVIKNGAGFEPVLEELLNASSNKNVLVADTSKGIELLQDEAEGPEGNPHIWLDPGRAVLQIENIRDALVTRDPDNADFYRQNAAGYIEEFRKLDEGIKQKVATFKKKDFVSFHPAFVYFAKRYGLRQAATIEEFPGKEPTVREIGEIIKTIKNLKITAIFAEPQFSPRIVETIAKDLGIQVRVLDPMETGDLSNDSYISITKRNVQTLEEVLK